MVVLLNSGLKNLTVISMFINNLVCIQNKLVKAKYIFCNGIFLFLLALFLCVELNAHNFNLPRTIDLPNRQFAVATDDLNKDGIPDLILGGDPAQNQSGTIKVFLGKGNGNFHTPQEYVVGVNPAFGVAPFVENIRIVDLDNDDNLDVAVTHGGLRGQNNTNPLLITILFGDGFGSLETTDSYRFDSVNGPFYSTALEFADLNNDDLPDVVIGGQATFFGELYFLKNLGSRNFSTSGPQLIFDWVNGVKSGHFNNDSNIDLAISSFEGITILYGDGNYNFNDGVLLNNEINFNAIESKDINQDGLSDLITSKFKANEYRVFLQGKEGFTENSTIFSTDVIGDHLKSADINNDGFDDVIISQGSEDGGTQVFYGQGNGNFTSSEVISTMAAADLALSDFDINGKIDFVHANFSSASNIQSSLYLNAPNPSRYYSDFNGDTKSDLTVYRPGTGTWWTLFSDDFSYQNTKFGLPTDKPVAGNYDGDNKTDQAVYRDGVWFILNSSDDSISIENWGLSEDIPVPADYDNDGKMNLAVFRPSDGNWYIRNDESFSIIKWGIKTDKPVPNDYDGDGKTDIAVWREAEGNWYVLKSSDDQFNILKFGQVNDLPISADYDGDGKADLAVYRNGVWFIFQSKTGTVRFEYFGLAEDTPTPNDFDGDGKNDIAIYRLSEGRWYILKSSNRTVDFIKWGITTDIPN